MEHSFAMYVPHVSLRKGYEGNAKPSTNLPMGNVLTKPSYDSEGFRVTYPATDLLVGDV